MNSLNRVLRPLRGANLEVFKVRPPNPLSSQAIPAAGSHTAPNPILTTSLVRNVPHVPYRLDVLLRNQPRK